MPGEDRGVKPYRIPTVFTPDERGQMRALWLSGHTSPEIAIAMQAVGVKVCASDVRRMASRWKWERGVRGPIERTLSPQSPVRGWPVLRYGNTEEGQKVRDREFSQAVLRQALELHLVKFEAR